MCREVFWNYVPPHRVCPPMPARLSWTLKAEIMSGNEHDRDEWAEIFLFTLRLSGVPVTRSLTSFEFCSCPEALLDWGNWWTLRSVNVQQAVKISNDMFIGFKSYNTTQFLSSRNNNLKSNHFLTVLR